MFLIHEISHQEKLALETETFVWVYGQFCFLLNWFIGLFVQQYQWEELIDIFVFFAR